MEEAEEKIIHIVLEEGIMCALTNRGRIFIQTPAQDAEGNYEWREVKLPDFKNG
ncbi:MAG: hypothetical protein Q8P63_03230 [Candidatus Nealsonbacteria bacterium]|nr:hypothetical protein [Candidatus Nealsonbacteria bacterium]